MSMLPADAHRVLEKGQGPVRDLDGTLRQFTLKIAGKSYRCTCQCNVFHKPDYYNDELYECNGCGQQFEAA